ncbi:MAG TPA: hypothetical protein VG368_02025, partial [Acidimicrobiales bacterium]|nr:hypothetical protein [Acidimicrobiales bacterium]
MTSFPLEHGHVLLHGGKAHVVVARKRRNRLLTRDGTLEDVSTRPIRERLEDVIDVCVRQNTTYNHVVALYVSNPRNARGREGRRTRLARVNSYGTSKTAGCGL